MRYEVAAEHRTYSFCRAHAPAATVAAGDEVLLHCHDCTDNLVVLQPDGSAFAKHDPARDNPVTGPVAVQGAEPGMTLVAHVLQVKCHEQGLMWTTDRKTGVLAVRVPQVTEQQVSFMPGYGFPPAPIIGVLGVAPALGNIPATHPGRHGGNLDCTDIRQGARVYLPVTVPGALLSCGDLHALQSDGEIGGTGVEVRGDVLLQVQLLPRIISPWPIVEQAQHFSVLTAAPTLDEAAELAVAAACDLLAGQLGVADTEARMLLGMVCDLRVNQIVNPLKGARVCIPKELLPQLQF